MRIGLIGGGNMGSALIGGYLTVNPSQEKNIYTYDKDGKRLKTLCSKYGIHSCNDIVDVTVHSDVIIIAVKPNVFDDVMKEVIPAMDWQEKVITSIAAGISLEHMEDLCREIGGYREEKDKFCCKLVRVMPNTPALIGRGMSALCRNKWVMDAEFHHIINIFKAVGKAEEVSEDLMDCVTGVSGSSPAYVYLFIEALADGAVAQGMSRKQAYIFAAQAVMGAADMVLTTGNHPGELKDMVCSPGGTTMDAVNSLEKHGFRSAVIEAVSVATNKSKAMTK